MGGRRVSGFFPAPGTNYSVGEEPIIARRLNELARALRIRLIGISGYRTPLHSIEVGGSANDPHTMGEASDTPGIENVPESTLERFGLTRPFPGMAEADHIQLFGGRTRGRATTKTYSLAELWTQAGGSRNLAPIMAAIAMAESGGVVSAQGPPNSDGTVDRGLWQINSSHSQFDAQRLLSDPLYNARAAVSIERSQGLGAWTTYSSGAYRSYLGSPDTYGGPTFGRTRPGGAEPPASSVGDMFASYEAGLDSPLPAGTNPQSEDVSWLSKAWKWFITPPDFSQIPKAVEPFKDTVDAIHSTADFLQAIAWIFHPKNILRSIEFLVGITLMAAGFHAMIEVYRNAPEDAAPARAARGAKRAAGAAFSMTPPGRALRVKRAAGFGKRAARAKVRSQESQQAAKRAQQREAKRQGQQRNKREGRKTSDIPF